MKVMRKKEADWLMYLHTQDRNAVTQAQERTDASAGTHGERTEVTVLIL